MSYFQPTRFNVLPKVVKNLLIINGLFFLATIVLSPDIDLYESLALYHWDRNEFRIWQPITYMFMHGDFMHILFNMWGVWMFGTQLENLWGSKRFLKFYILTGLGAGILQIILFPGTSLVGASGALFGLLLGFGMMFPNAKLMLIFLPIPIKAKYFVIIYGCFELYYLFTSTGNIAHLAHIGGMIFGFFIIKYWQREQNSS